MKGKLLATATLLLAIPLAACGTAKSPARPGQQPAPVEIVVSAAASLSDALQEAQPAFESAHPQVKLRFNFGSSGALQQQLEQGAPADLFISAATKPMDALVAKGLVDKSAVKTLASNKVVLIASQQDPATVRSWEDLKSEKVQRIAIGNPLHVPAGQYGKAVLENLGLWPAVQKRLILGEDVRQVLHYVESGEVRAGIVYATDAALSAKVRVVAAAPPGSHDPVLYPMAVMKESKHQSEAQALADFLLVGKGKETLTKYGFTSGQ